MHSRDTTIRIHAETKSTIMTNEHSPLEKYTSHTLFEMVWKGCVWEVSSRLDRLQHIDPKFLCLKQHFFLILLASQPGFWGPSPLWELVLTTASYLQLTEPVCGTGLYNCLTPTCFFWASHLHPIQPVHSQGYTLISSTECTCYLHRCISHLIARSWVNMQHLLNIKLEKCFHYDKCVSLGVYKGIGIA